METAKESIAAMTVISNLDFGVKRMEFLQSILGLDMAF